MDDAGVFKINEQQALVQTVDFFTPMVDDPYVFGEVAAANALSDIYAMGGTPLTALNITCFNTCDLDLDILRRILAGGADKLQEAQCVLVGGHTVEDKEPKYGLAVTGIVDVERVITNSGARPGAAIVLTKPLGSGILSTALKGGLLSQGTIEHLTGVMVGLNDRAAAVMRRVGVLAATDITGFGLLGHAWEICRGSKVGMRLALADIPVMDETVEYARMGVIPGGAYTNLRYLQDKVDFNDIPDYWQALLCDPQTSGGLLLIVEDGKREAMVSGLEQAGQLAAVIGEVTADSGKIEISGYKEGD